MAGPTLHPDHQGTTALYDVGRVYDVPTQKAQLDHVPLVVHKDGSQIPLAAVEDGPEYDAPHDAILSEYSTIQAHEDKWCADSSDRVLSFCRGHSIRDQEAITSFKPVIMGSTSDLDSPWDGNAEYASIDAGPGPTICRSPKPPSSPPSQTDSLGTSDADYSTVEEHRHEALFRDGDDGYLAVGTLVDHDFC
jgi:hypothetical protein